MTGAGAGVGEAGGNRAAQVLVSTTPVTGRPLAVWKVRTAASVAGPNEPSAVRERAFWTRATLSPVAPRRRSVPALMARATSARKSGIDILPGSIFPLSLVSLCPATRVAGQPYAVHRAATSRTYAEYCAEVQPSKPVFMASMPT